jgi:N-acetylglucosaminyltransferase II (MGAT2)
MKTAFSREDFVKRNIDTFLFLEEDYIVAPTIYQALVGGLNAMDEFEKETKRGFLGLSLDPTNGNRKAVQRNIDPDAWYGAPFTSGPMTLHRSTFAKIQQSAASFCGRDGFDEYNWDWTFVHMQGKELIPHTVLFPARPLAKHIGLEGGMHGHNKNVARSKEEFENLETRFLGTKLKGTPFVNPVPFRKQGFGGWGHPADQEHCMKLLAPS